MCLSATASFAASGGLAAVGVASWQFATPRQKAVAAIPLLSAVQQATEGVQWLLIERGPASAAVGYAYLFFAYLLWPTIILLSVYVADPERRSLLRWFLVVGVAVSTYLLVMLVPQPLKIFVAEQHLRYDSYVAMRPLLAALYIMVTCGSMLISSKPYNFWKVFL